MPRSWLAAPTAAVPSPGSPSAPARWTLQPHPEFVAPLADHLLAGRVELIGAERVATARASLTHPLDRARVAGWIARFFADATDATGP